MSAADRKNQLIFYLGIGLVLLLGIFAADHFMTEINIFKNKTALYGGAGKKAGGGGDVDGNADDHSRLIDAPPQPLPVANGLHKNSNEADDLDAIQHNYRLLPKDRKYSGEARNEFANNVVIDSRQSRRLSGSYATQFRLAQSQVGEGDSAASSGRKGTKGSNDRPDYFGAPTVLPRKAPSSEAEKRESDSDQSDLVVVRKTDTEHKLESKLQAGKRALRMERYEAALSFFNDLYQSFEDEPRVLMGRAIALQHLGRKQAARNAYNTLLRHDPDNIQAKINAYGIIKNTKPGLALRRLKDLYENHPENAGLAAQIGLVNAEMQKYDEASKYLQIAASIAPNNPQHFFNLGIIEEHKGNRGKAIRYYEKAADKIAIGGRSVGLSKEKIYDRLTTLRDS